MMRQFTEWLESTWATPSYSGWLLTGISLCFFAAATNTMAGWLYVISGTIFALLTIGAILSGRSLAKLDVRRRPIEPASAGEELSVELEIKNPTRHPKTLLQLKDMLPSKLALPMLQPVEAISPRSIYRWVYYLPVKKRGIYEWDEVQFRTGTPLGLFWCRRSHKAPAKAIVYPNILPLTSCPLLDPLGQENYTVQTQRRSRAATEGLTKGLRPYRHGDSLRSIHWRLSARWGQFKVKELEMVKSDREIVICLDTGSTWSEDNFERAVIAAASLYFYASQRRSLVRFWSGKTGLIWGHRRVLEALAAIGAGCDATPSNPIPLSPCIWLTSNPSCLNSLPSESRWLLFSEDEGVKALSSLAFHSPGSIIAGASVPLQGQLQRELGHFVD